MCLVVAYHITVTYVYVDGKYQIVIYEIVTADSIFRVTFVENRMSRSNSCIKRYPTSMIIIALFISMLFKVSIAGATEDIGVSADELIANVKLQEHKIANLHIGFFHLDSEIKNIDENEWHPYKLSMEGEAWFDGLPNSKARINVKRRTIRTDGQSGWVIQSFDSSYDGRKGRVAEHFEGIADNNLIKIGVGKVIATSPTHLQDGLSRYATGTQFTVPYFSTGTKPFSIGNYLERLKAKGELTVKKDITQVGAIICIGNPESPGTCFWFDQQKGYSLVGYQVATKEADSPLKIDKRFKVQELLAVGNNLWYPVKAVYERIDPEKPNTVQRWHYSAKNITINDPNYDDKIYTLQFPANYKITDHIIGVGYTSGMETQELNHRLDDIVKDIKSDLNKVNELKLQSNEQYNPAVTLTSTNHSITVVRYWYFAIVLILLLVGCAIYVCYRNKMCKSK